MHKGSNKNIDLKLGECYKIGLWNGGMAEWLKAAVLKTVECQSSVGSNPTPSAIFFGEMAEPAEGARLLSE